MIQPQPRTASREAFHGLGVRGCTIDTSYSLKNNERQEQGTSKLLWASSLFIGHGAPGDEWQTRRLDFQERLETCDRRRRRHRGTSEGTGAVDQCTGSGASAARPPASGAGASRR